MPAGDRDTLCDINILVALVHEAHAHSALAQRWLQRVRRAGSIRVCRVVQLGLLRLLTSPRVFGEEALAASDAWVVYETMMSDSRFAYAEEPSRLGFMLREAILDLQPGATIGTDIFLAAFARAANLRLVTFDRGFRRFSGIDVINPA